jgi:hypothetical protein
MTTDAPECKTPIVLIIFNRPEHTEAVFRRIAQVRPAELLIVADGPRPDRLGESALCQRARQIVTQADWPCKILTNFAEANMGCGKRVISGLNWAFEHVEEAIILEDDILPDLSFFRFCDEMLERFRNDSRISMITGFNIVQDHLQTPWSYFYSQLSHLWGWATWRRSWVRYDEHLSEWPAIKAAGIMREIFERPKECRYWVEVFDVMHKGASVDTWDYQWVYTNLINHSLAVTSGTNLVENIGFGPGATHTLRAEDVPPITAGTLSFPLIHPPAMVPLRTMDELDARLSGFYIPALPQRAIRKFKRKFAEALQARRGPKT